MVKNYFEAVAELCRVNENDVNCASQKELVNNYILPRLVVRGGQDIRGWRISPTFMEFMARFGQTCVERDRETGELLLELAMQRISNGAVVHAVKGGKGVAAPYNFWESLPEEYRKYSACYDQPGLMGQEEWNFLKMNLYYCINRLNNQLWAEHAKKICFGLLTHISCSGRELNGYLWSEALVNESLKEVYEFVEEVAVRSFGVQQVAQWLLPTWRSHKKFFKKYSGEIDFKTLFTDWGDGEQGLDYDLEGRNYFGKKTRKVLKFFGVYQSKIAEKVKAEMLAA